MSSYVPTIFIESLGCTPLQTAACVLQRTFDAKTISTMTVMLLQESKPVLDYARICTRIGLPARQVLGLADAAQHDRWVCRRWPGGGAAQTGRRPAHHPQAVGKPFGDRSNRNLYGSCCTKIGAPMSTKLGLRMRPAINA